jgi:hypothetical protein
VRHFNVELRQPGKYVVAGGVAYNQDFLGRLAERKVENGST